MDHDKIRARLSAYKDGELNEGLRDQISRHLQMCDACGGEMRELDRIDSLVRGLPEIGVQETFSSAIIAKALAAKAPRRWKSSLPRRILDRFLPLADSVFELLAGYEPREGSLDEFGDSPPLSLSHAYFQLIGH